VALEWGGRENQAAVSQCRFSLWTSQALATLTALVWSKTHKYIFLRKGEREQVKNLSPESTSGSGPVIPGP